MKVLAQPVLDLDRRLAINPPLAVDWLVKFLRHECITRRNIPRAVVGVSGGVDSAVTLALCARAFGPENVLAVRMPYTLSSPDSLEHARLVASQLGTLEATVDISAMVDGYVDSLREPGATRIGNVCSRCRMTVLYDQSAAEQALVIGTSNKTERLLGYFTWHGDDAPAINPLGDLWKTQVWALARELGIPDVVIAKPPSADLVKGQTDTGDLGFDYPTADRALCELIRGTSVETLIRAGMREDTVRKIDARLRATHWKRRLPTVAIVSDSAIGESYLRPVDL